MEVRAEQGTLRDRAEALREKAQFGGVQAELVELVADLAAAVEGPGGEPNSPAEPTDPGQQTEPTEPGQQTEPTEPGQQPPPADQTG